MTPTKIAETHTDEVIKSGLAGLIPVQRGILKLLVPPQMKYRAVFLFIEAIPTVPAEDFELEAELEFRRAGVGILAMPASIAENSNASGLIQKSRLTCFNNVALGTIEGMSAILGAPLVNGSLNTPLTPQKLQVECDEIWLNLLGSRNTPGNSFSGWRALLVVRSSETQL